METLPLSTSLKDDTLNGTFTYMSSIRQDKSIEGLFVFSFYIPNKREYTRAYYNTDKLEQNIYIEGLLNYSYCIKKAESVFKNWKILLYTDTYSYNFLQNVASKSTDDYNQLFKDPNIHFCLVHWPYYSPIDKDEISGFALRPMRFRAFFDFSTIPIFIRDADTLFAQSQTGYNKYMNAESEKLYTWEMNYYRNAIKLPQTFIMATSLGYKKPWHKNEILGKEAPFGAFAGLQSIIPPAIPCFQTYDLWNQAIDYILSHSVRIKEPTENNYTSTFLGTRKPKLFKNDGLPAQIGRDEQILLFIFLPACINNVFFFELDYFNNRIFITKMKSWSSKQYPEIIFARGSNKNLQAVFEASFKNANKATINQMTANIFQKNKSFQTKKENELSAQLKTLQNMKTNIVGEETISGWGEQKQFISVIRAIFNFISKTSVGKEANSLWDTIDKLYYDIERKKSDYRINFLGSNTPLELDKTELQNLITERDTAIKKILYLALTVTTREELLNYYLRTEWRAEKEDFDNILNYYEKSKNQKLGGRRRKITTRRHRLKKRSTRRL